MVGSSIEALVDPGLAPRSRHDCPCRPDAGRPRPRQLRIAGDPDRAVEAVVTNMLDDDSVAGVVFNSRDTTERRRLEDNLRIMAYHDALTSLPNRFAFLERLEAGGEAGDPALLHLLMADVDRFKSINDGFGHGVGDQVLVRVGEVLSQVAARYQGFVARIGGDEFGILVESDDPSRVAALADEVTALTFSPPGQARHLSVTLSAGWAANGAAAEAGIDLVRAADLALDESKREKNASVAAFSPEIMLGWAERFALQSQLRGVADRGELRLHYQPIFDVTGHTLRALEALVRWQHPTRGLLGPGGFIPIAEQSGAIIEVGGWALRDACRQLRAWGCATPPSGPDFVYLSVNVSTVELREPGYVERVADALRTYEVHPARIQLEITESVLATDPAFVVSLLADLKAIGVRLAIDDFGTGYSSLAYLATMPVDAIKVDRSFVIGMLGSERMASVVRATLSLAASLGLSVVAEGVETTDQRDALAALGCTLVQGYLYSKPVAPGEVHPADPSHLAPPEARAA
ncbi:MAG: bifunctional diguanylate cyclase/phosphodiesterase [Dehalococcoidia bacterium]